MNVKLARIKLGLTQTELRKLLNINLNKMVEIEKENYKNLTYPLMLKISEVLGVPVIELFFAD